MVCEVNCLHLKVFDMFTLNVQVLLNFKKNLHRRKLFKSLSYAALLWRRSSSKYFGLARIVTFLP